jgi:hypothetical protein
MPMAVCANALVPESSGISGGFPFLTICIAAQVPSVSNGFSTMHRLLLRFLHYTGVSQCSSQEGHMQSCRQGHTHRLNLCVRARQSTNVCACTAMSVWVARQGWIVPMSRVGSEVGREYISLGSVCICVYVHLHTCT